MHSTVFSVLVVVYLGWVGIYAFSLYLLTRGSRICPRSLRDILCYFHGWQYLGSDGVTFQKGLFDCGDASVKMLLSRLSAGNPTHVLEREPETKNLRSMSDIYEFMTRNGVGAAGYAFSSTDQLELFMASFPDAAILLLMESYHVLLPAGGLVMGPIALIIPLLRRLRVARWIVRHWVVLHGIDAEGVQLLDPALGKIGMNRRSFRRVWSGNGLVVSQCQAGHVRG